MNQEILKNEIDTVLLQLQQCGGNLTAEQAANALYNKLAQCFVPDFQETEANVLVRSESGRCPLCGQILGSALEQIVAAELELIDSEAGTDKYYGSLGTNAARDCANSILSAVRAK